MNNEAEPNLPELPDETGTDALNRIAARYTSGHIPLALALIDDVLEAFSQHDGASRTGHGDGDALRKIESKQRQAWHILVSYQANQKTALDMQMSTRVMALELGYYTVAGADNVAEIARKLGIKKQTVNKCAANFQTKLGLPPRPGQRGKSARENMSGARKEQLAH